MRPLLLLAVLYSAFIPKKVWGSCYQEIEKVPLIDFDKLLENAVAARKTTLDNFLELLRSKQEEFADPYRHQYVYSSKSSRAEDINKDHPRILAHFGNAIVGMVTDPKSKYYGELEVMQYRPQTADYAFRVFTFDGVGKPREGSNQRCLSCHGNPPRPLWGVYRFWPGAHNPMNGEDDEVSKISLKWFAEELNPKLGAVGRFVHFAPLSKDPKRPRPPSNRSLTDRIGTFTGHRLAHLISTAKNFDSYKFSIVAELKGCAGTGFLPDAVVKAHTAVLGKNVAGTISDTNENVRKILLQQMKNHYESVGQSLPKAIENALKPGAKVGEVTERVGKLRFLLEGQGEPLRNAFGLLSPNSVPRERSYSFESVDSADFFNCVVENALSQPALSELNKLSCEELKRKGLEALGKLSFSNEGSPSITSSH